MELSGLIGILILIADIFAVIRIFKSSAADLHKVLWTLLILLLPLLGLIIWFLAGPGDKRLGR